MTEVFCTSLSERKSESLIESSPVNSVEMLFDWTICSLSTFPDVQNVEISSGRFPSNSKLAQFHLMLGPRGKQSSQKGYISLDYCVFDMDKVGKSQPVNNTLIIRNYGAENPHAVVFKAPTIFPCWGKINFLLFEKTIKQTCLTIELSRVYIVY